MALDLSVIVPCYNEEPNIPVLVARTEAALLETGAAFEIVLVDDASTDKTREVIEQEMAARDNVVGCFHENNRGIVGGWRTGLGASNGRWVVTIDADLQYQPEDIVRLYQAAERGGADLVQGWRSFTKENSPLRKALSIGLSVALNLMFGMRLKDIKSGFVLYRREAFAAVLDYKSDFSMFQHFITIAAHSKGYRIEQVPVTFEKRYAGESFITEPFSFSLGVLREIPMALSEYRFGRGGK